MQPQSSLDIDTHKTIPFLPTRYTVVVQRKGVAPWTHRMAKEHGTNDHDSRGYRIRVTKTGHAITTMKRHIKPNSISAEDHI